MRDLYEWEQANQERLVAAGWVGSDYALAAEIWDVAHQQGREYAYMMLAGIEAAERKTTK